MNDEFKSNKTTWLIVLLLSSPVMVQFIKMARKTVEGPKYNPEQTMLFAEYLAERKMRELQQQNQNLAYMPAQNPSLAEGHVLRQNFLHPSIPYIDTRTSLLRMQQELKQQLERVAMLHKKQGHVTSCTISGPDGAQFVIQSNQPNIIRLAQLDSKKLTDMVLSENKVESITEELPT